MKYFSFWRLIYAIPTWILFTAIFIPLMLLGWILIPIAAVCKAYKAEENPVDPLDPNYHFTWPFMFIYDNYEDGIANNNYSKLTNMTARIISWSANRNPVNNLRIVPYLTCIVDPIRVKYIGSLDDVLLYDTKIPQWFFCWQGIYSDFYWQFNFNDHLYRAWVGWKLYPTDIYGVTEYRKYGTGFALQFNKVL